MARQQREITPDDLRLPQKAPLDITHGVASVEREQIQLLDRALNQSTKSPGKGLPSEEELAELAFNEEYIEVRLEMPQSVGDDNKPVAAWGPFGVRGRQVWLRPGEIETIQRKYVEVILRSQPFRVQTEVIKGQGQEQNLLHRYVSRRCPLTIVHDPNPRGAEWARRIVMEN
jgi:hypothetical protein